MNVGRRLRARRLRSAPGSINSGRHILESRCAERCANDEFLTSFRATLNIMKGGTQGFPRHEVSDKQEVLFEDVSPSTAFEIRQPVDEFKMP